MVWLGRSPLRRLRRAHPASIAVCVIISLIFYNEFLAYLISSFWWSHLPNEGPKKDNVRVLFVADPQLLGLHNEKRFVGPLSRWDNDRYLWRTFHMAHAAVDPDVVVFMGDLLDEGSRATREEFAQYYARFVKVFSFSNNTKRVYLAGDNDVGGENFDMHQTWKVARFERFFNKEAGVTPIKFVNFIHMNIQFGDTYDGQTQKLVSTLRSETQAGVRILLNHMSILRRHYGEYEEMLLALAPSLIFTAHSHKSYTISCANCQNHEPSPEERRDSVHWVHDWKVHTYPLHDKTGFQEVVIPTCSYRMGVTYMGYGAAVIASSGNIRYTVLWIPSRYVQLYLYIYVPSILFAIFIVKWVAVTCYTYRAEFCNISEEELRRKHVDLPNFSGCLGYAMRAIHFAIFCWHRLRKSRRR